MEIEYTTTRMIEAAESTISAQWSIDNEQAMINLYGRDIPTEISDLMAERIALDIDREILESFSVPEGILGSLPSKTRCEPEDFKDMESYREEILVKKYGLR